MDNAKHYRLKDGEKAESLLFNRELWDEIEEDLGEVTDFEIIRDSGKNDLMPSEIRFKSNGVDKLMACNDSNFKFFIQCAYYVTELKTPFKKYTHSSSNPQQAL